jgi:hypothetical protein
MHRPAAQPSGGASALDGRAMAAAQQTVAPLLELMTAGSQARQLGRMARFVELRDRALAVGEAALPRDSLTLASLLNNAAFARREAAEHARGTRLLSLDERITLAQSTQCALSLRCLDISDARWRAGTLFTPSAEDVVYMSALGRDPVTHPAEIFVVCANEALGMWLPGALPAEDKPRLRAVYGEVRAALTLDVNYPWMTPERAALRGALTTLAFAVLDVSGMSCGADAAARQVHLQLHAVCGVLPQAKQQAVCELIKRVSGDGNATMMAAAVQHVVSERSFGATSDALCAERMRNAAADAARHGLRTCALPECGKAHAKQFKVCGRCRSVVYCSPAHQTADWRRHKREDGCKAAA